MYLVALTTLDGKDIKLMGESACYRTEKEGIVVYSQV